MHGIGLSMIGLSIVAGWGSDDFEIETIPAHLTVEDRVRRGEFAPVILRATDPVVPELLLKPAVELTPDEALALPLVLSAYNSERAEVAAEHEENNRLIDDGNARLKAALAEELRLADHPKLDLLWQMARDYAHEQTRVSVGKDMVDQQKRVAKNFHTLAGLLI
jgi:hypothetical protein